jgi:RimJ/RimL family protein N-acetyltransferase
MAPIQFNEKSGEPFIPLKSHPDIILTPLRFDDVPHMVEMLNDERIIRWLSGPPYPYYEGKCEV